MSQTLFQHLLSPARSPEIYLLFMSQAVPIKMGESQTNWNKQRTEAFCFYQILLSMWNGLISLGHSVALLSRIEAIQIIPVSHSCHNNKCLFSSSLNTHTYSHTGADIHMHRQGHQSMHIGRQIQATYSTCRHTPCTVILVNDIANKHTVRPLRANQIDNGALCPRNVVMYRTRTLMTAVFTVYCGSQITYYMPG